MIVSDTPEVGNDKLLERLLCENQPFLGISRATTEAVNRFSGQTFEAIDTADNLPLQVGFGIWSNRIWRW